VADEDIRMLLQAILDYFGWLKVIEEPRGRQIRKRYAQILIEFIIFSVHKDIVWKDMFTFDTFREFRKYSRLQNASYAIISLSGYLHEKGRISQPMEIPNYQVKLPDIYEQYLLYLEQTKEFSDGHIRGTRRVLASFHHYLESHKITLPALKIKDLDAFVAEFKVSQTTRRIYRYHLQGFLKYLYYERRILKTDLAPMLVGPPLFSQSKPPKFLRPQEVRKLFASLKLSTPTDVRTYAMVHLAYTLGLRPVEISTITLDDISFQKGELTLRYRKANNPITLPLPDQTIKAIAAYVLKVRPKSPCREIFLSFFTPYRPISPAAVIHHISKAMKEAGLPSTAYWLRHSYAQSLLHTGRSIYEIKEMLGHENIQSTHRYLYIDTELMRKVLFNETL
jgi:site-specific recombinase XerD